MQPLITTPSQANLEQAAELAENELARRRATAEDLAAEAAKLTKAFDVEPSEELFAKVAVTKQRAKNAQSAVAEQEKVANLAREQVRAFDRALVADEIAQKEQAIRAQLATATDLLVQAFDGYEAAISALASHHRDRIDAQRQGVGLGQLSLESIAHGLNERLERFKGRSAHEKNVTDAGLQVVCPQQRGDAHLAVTFRCSLGTVPNPLH